MSFFSNLEDRFNRFFSSGNEEDDYESELVYDDDYRNEDSPRVTSALPARAVRPMDAVIMEPHSYSDVRRAAEAMKKGLIVLIVLGDNLEDGEAGRFVDFMGGAVFFGQGELELLNEEVLICAPSNVHLETDNLPRLSGIPQWKGPSL